MPAASRCRTSWPSRSAAAARRRRHPPASAGEDAGAPSHGASFANYAGVRTIVTLILIATACQPVQHAPVRNAAAPAIERTSTMPKTLHVVSLGDSLAYGAGDESGEGITGRLEDELRVRGVTAVETVNLGVNGAQTNDVLARLKQERTRKAITAADAVVLSIGANDLFRTPHSREEIMRNPE